MTSHFYEPPPGAGVVGAEGAGGVAIVLPQQRVEVVQLRQLQDTRESLRDSSSDSVEGEAGTPTT